MPVYWASNQFILQTTVTFVHVQHPQRPLIVYIATMLNLVNFYGRQNIIWRDQQYSQTLGHNDFGLALAQLSTCDGWPSQADKHQEVFMINKC